MKKLFAGLILGIGLTVTTAVFADELKRVTATIRADFNVRLNGQTLALSKQPVIIDGSMYLPLKDVAEAAGLAVKWNEATLTAELSDAAPPANKPTEHVSNVTSDGLKIIEIDGMPFVGMYEISSKYENSGYAFRFRQENKEYDLIFYSEKSRSVDNFDTILQNVEFKIHEGASYIHADVYTSTVLPLLQVK